MRHPSEYILIIKKGVSCNPINPNKSLFRLHPKKEMPDGYMKVENLFGRVVYKPSGKLNPKFMAIKRFV